MKAVMLSIHPKWCCKILNGEKTVEIRKTKPKISVPFKCYIYCTKPSKKYQTVCGCMVLNSDELYRHPTQGIKHGDSIELMCCDDYSKNNFLNGKVIGEFTCGGIGKNNIEGLKWWDMLEHLLKCSCLKMSELQEYVANKIFYTWSIDNLVIYDKPKDLSEFGLTRPPQSWCYVEELE